MEKETFYEKLRRLEIGAVCVLKWDRQNGTIDRLVRFDGFDEQYIPMLYFPGGTRLNFDLIGGYHKIVSIQEECPDGARCR
jgi:hypothetical protein